MTAQKGFTPVILIIGIAAAATIGFFLFSQSSNQKTTKEGAPANTTTSAPPATQKPLGNFEFLDAASFAKLSSLPFAKKVHIVVASSGTPDIRNHRPIKIEVLVDDQIVWEAVLEDLPTVNGITENCRGADGCSMDGPTIDSAWKGKKIEVRAYGKDGELLAIYSE